MICYLHLVENKLHGGTESIHICVHGAEENAWYTVDVQLALVGYINQQSQYAPNSLLELVHALSPLSAHLQTSLMSPCFLQLCHGHLFTAAVTSGWVSGSLLLGLSSFRFSL